MIRFLPENRIERRGKTKNSVFMKPRISAVFIFYKIFSYLFCKKRLTFFDFQFIVYGLSSWEPFIYDSQPLKFCGLRNER